MEFRKISIISIYLFTLITGLGVPAFCSSDTDSSMSWKEEVLLHDGGKIIVKRFFRLGSKPTFDSREGRALDETISFTLPGSDKKIYWKTDFRDFVPEPNSLNLLVLDLVNGIPYIAAYPAGCIAYNKWKRPNPPYLLFKYIDNAWKRIPLAEFPAELSKVNIIVGHPPAKLLKSFYTAEQVEQQNRDIHTKEYKTIIRTPLDPEAVSVSCPDYNSERYRSFKAPLPLDMIKK